MKNDRLVTTLLILLGLAATVQAEQMSAPGKTTPGHMVHDYKPVQVPADVPIPQLAMQLHRDAVSGVNLHLEVRNFALGPPEQKPSKTMLNGHAHLYVNGRKIQRLYGPDVHIPGKYFKPGINVVLVSLNAHTHAVWQLGKKQFLVSSFINLKHKPFVLHSFSSVPLVAQN